MEESFVLNLADARMMQILNVHEVTRLCPLVIRISTICCVRTRPVYLTDASSVRFLLGAHARWVVFHWAYGI